MDNILLALDNSYHPTQPQSIIANAIANANDNAMIVIIILIMIMIIIIIIIYTHVYTINQATAFWTSPI